MAVLYAPIQPTVFYVRAIIFYKPMNINATHAMFLKVAIHAHKIQLAKSV